MCRKSKTERPRKRWIDEVEEDLKINVNKEMANSGRRPEGMEEKLLEAKVHNVLQCKMMMMRMVRNNVEIGQFKHVKSNTC